MSLLAIKAQLLLSMPSGGEWLWIILAIIVLFGGKKIPELARGLGKGIREFNDAKTGIKNEIEAGLKDNNKENNAS
jgi:sec-independent protein translocase protein TatA